MEPQDIFNKTLDNFPTTFVTLNMYEQHGGKKDRDSNRIEVKTGLKYKLN